MMKTYSAFLLALCMFIATASRSQTNNALAFDGINDYVSVPGASSLIAGAPGLSLTAWVYPTNPAPVFPNFDGFAGFRNNTNADFYLLHYTATSVEARFTGASGINYTIVSPVLTLNTWTHLAFTYDGAMLRLYKNGIIADSLPASDVITSTVEDFLIGDQLYQGTHYYLSGRVDEVSLWNRALLPSELTCLHINGIDTSAATGLQLYYKCNQGIAGGVNTGLTTLIDETGNSNGILNNFALNGSNSNFIAGASQVNPVFAFVCPDSVYNFNGTLITTPGVYFDTLTNAAGCDSVVQLTLSDLLVDTSVTQNGAVLTANHLGTFYQWLDCNNGFSPVPGANQQSFTPPASGSYAVIVLHGSCYDTSSCYTVTGVGINTPVVQDNIVVYPTSSSSLVTIRLDKPENNYFLQLTDIGGRVLAEEPIGNSREYNFDISRFAKGHYQLLLSNEKREIKVFKIVRE